MEKQKVYHSKMNCFENPEDRFIILESSMNKEPEKDFISLLKEEMAYQGLNTTDLSFSTGIEREKLLKFLGRNGVKLSDWETHKIKTKLGM
jgi:hypothetical protein